MLFGFANVYCSSPMNLFVLHRICIAVNGEIMICILESMDIFVTPENITGNEYFSLKCQESREDKNNPSSLSRRNNATKLIVWVFWVSLYTMHYGHIIIYSKSDWFFFWLIIKLNSIHWKSILFDLMNGSFSGSNIALTVRTGYNRKFNQFTRNMYSSPLKCCAHLNWIHMKQTMICCRSHEENSIKNRLLLKLHFKTSALNTRWWVLMSFSFSFVFVLFYSVCCIFTVGFFSRSVYYHS